MKQSDHPQTARSLLFPSFAWLAAFAIGCSAADDGESGIDTPQAHDAGSDQQVEPGEPPVHPAPALVGVDAAVGIALLNEYRRVAGLEAVQLDESMSAGCETHIDYLIWEADNAGKPRCFLSHTEDNHDNPFYSVESESAGKDSVLSCGYGSDGLQSLAQGVELWMNTLYHRLPLIDSGLHTVGMATKNGYNCINYRKGTDSTKLAEPVLWPPPGMVDVPRSFVGFEAPCPTLPANPLATNGMDCGQSGFIITASWFNWGNQLVRVFKGVIPEVRLINEETGQDVPLLTWYGDGVEGHDPAPRYVGDTLALVPQEPLMENTSFRVEFSGLVSGEPTELSWAFTTGARLQ